MVIVVALAIVVLVLTEQGHDRRVAGHTIALSAAEQHGAKLFATTCQSCHALAASHSYATVGPNLDYVQPTPAQTKSVIASGMTGPNASMPAALLMGPDAADVAAYLAKVANRRNVQPPNP